MLHFYENFQDLYNWCILISFFLNKNKIFHHINGISPPKPQTSKGIFTLQFNFQLY